MKNGFKEKWEETSHGRVRPAHIEDTLSKKMAESIVSLGAKSAILDKCDENYGQWLCLTHDEQFDNGLQKDFHIGHGDHVLAWYCYAHGVEIP